MQLTKNLLVASAVLLASAGVAAAATSPSGVFKGTTHTKDAKGHPDAFQLQATFAKGKLTRLHGMGNWIPYNAKKSTSTFCGAANVYDTKGTATIAKKPAPKGFDWLFVITSTHKGYGWFTITLKGKWDSASRASSDVDFYEHKMPDKGHCDSGQLSVTLTKS